MNDNMRKKLLHVIILEIEVFVLMTVIAFPVMKQFKPVGIMTTGRGDLMRFRLAEGQDEIAERCECVQVDFGTKWCKHPAAFFNRDLVKYVKIDKVNRYAWHEVPAPLGTTEFRLAVHWKAGCMPSTRGPELRDISLGKRDIRWGDVRSNYELDIAKTIPCYWFRPVCFLNLSVFDFLVYAGGYLVTINALVVLAVLFLRFRGKVAVDDARSGHAHEFDVK